MRILFAICFLIAIKGPLPAQDISLIFSGEGATTVVDRVEIANLDAGITQTITGLDILQLILLPDTAASATEDEKPVALKPNMRRGSCKIEVYMRQPGAVKIELINSTGQVLIADSYHLMIGDYEFNLTGMKTGAHRLIITTPNNEYSHWVMSGNNDRNAISKLEPAEGFGATKLENYVMPDGKTITMPYRRGERLLFKATTGSLQAVVVVVPRHDDMVKFVFAPCIDADGNQYSTINIGSQIWMAENLKSTRFNDGSPIEQIQKISDWRDTKTAAYCWYDNNEHFRDWYGALYNHYVVKEGNVCPDGWRVPTDADWYTFEVYIDSTILINTALGWRGSHGGASLKASSGWSEGQNGFNAFGFTALPAGRRGSNGIFNSAGTYAYWWASTLYFDEKQAWSRYILPDYEFFYRGSFDLNYGYSIRCIKE